MPSRKNPLLGRWRITEMEVWDTDFVDMLEPAYITFEAKGGGEFVFGAVRGLMCIVPHGITEASRLGRRTTS